MPPWIIAISVFLIVALIRFFLRSRPTPIENPTLGIIDLSGGIADNLIEADRDALSSIFSTTTESLVEPPRCNVLLLYCKLLSDGSVENSNKNLSELVRQSGAAVAVVACDNDSESYTAALQMDRSLQANLAMTLSRGESKFPTFYQKLFTEMKRGTSMPVAWNRLAPQIPGADHSGVPDSICLMDAGQVSFK